VRPLVLGAAGFLGVNLVDALLAAGFAPRCGRRRTSNVIPLRTRRVDLVPADLDRPGELYSAMVGCDVVFHFAGHYPRTALHPATDLALGTRRMANVLDAAAAAGVDRLIYLSSTATVAPAQGRASSERDIFPRAPGFGLYHDLKWAMEAQALSERRVPVAVLCPGACLGAWDLKVGTSALLVATANGLRPPHPDGWVPIVDARDVAQAALATARVAPLPRRLLLAGSNLRLQDLLCVLARRYGVAAPAAPLSAGAARAVADEAEAEFERTRHRPSLSREIVDLVVHGRPVDATRAEHLLDLQYRPLSDTLDQFDAFARRMGFLPSPSPPVHA
jgi:dihydroflavonol-4-reductase